MYLLEIVFIDIKIETNWDYRYSCEMALSTHKYLTPAQFSSGAPVLEITPAHAKVVYKAGRIETQDFPSG
jgi:hypothetical protein